MEWKSRDWLLFIMAGLLYEILIPDFQALAQDRKNFTRTNKASESYLLADHTKFGKKNLIRYNEVKDYQLILTDSELEEEIQKDFCKHGGHIQICG